jgi:hypothetical protein
VSHQKQAVQKLSGAVYVGFPTLIHRAPLIELKGVPIESRHHSAELGTLHRASICPRFIFDASAKNHIRSTSIWENINLERFYEVGAPTQCRARRRGAPKKTPDPFYFTWPIGSSVPVAFLALKKAAPLRLRARPRKNSPS